MLGWTYELYHDKPEYDQYQIIQNNLSDFEIVYRLWATDENSNDKIIDKLFLRVLEQQGLVDNGDIEWLTNYFGTNVDFEEE